MMLRPTGIRTALLLFAFAHLATPAAAACERPDCRSATQSRPAGKPLQLGKFMRDVSAKSVKRAAKKRGSERHSPSRTHVHKRRPPPAAPTPDVMPDEAVAAFASQPSIPVRVVASDELNEIDRAAGATANETTGASQPAEQPAPVVAAEYYNDIDRKNDDDRRLASPAGGPADLSGESRAASHSWIERLWARLQYTFIAIAAALRYLIGY
jgi:hypothetical protein